MAGELTDTQGDFVGVVANNAAGNQIDFYARRSLESEVVLLEDDSAGRSPEVTITNDAPTEGQPA